jgi:hypothetical protein
MTAVQGPTLMTHRNANGSLPPNNGMQRTALRAAADAERCTSAFGEFLPRPL